MDEFITCMKKYATFSGRASRREYWMFVLILYSVLLPLYVLGMAGLAMDITTIIVLCFALYFIISLVCIIPHISVMVRRLHDTNKSGWYFFVCFIPIVGPFILLYYFVTAGDSHKNMYGPSPYVVNSHSETASDLDNTQASQIL